MSGKIDKGALGILGVLGAALGAVYLKENSVNGKGSFNDDDDSDDSDGALMLPGTTAYGDRIQQMIVESRENPFLDQEKPYGIDHPEYTLVLELIDTNLIPLPDFQVTTPDFTQGITHVEELMRITRANPAGILETNMVGYIDSKPKFFQAVHLLKPMIQGDQDIIDLQDTDENRLLNINQTAVGRVRKARFRINLVALASQRGMMIMAPVLPFSNLFHTFAAYNQRISAELAYREALRALENLVGGNPRMRRLGRY